MALTEAAVQAYELERVRDRLPVLYDLDDELFYANVEKKDVEVVSGRDMRVPLELRPGGNFGHYNPEGGDLGRGDGPGFDKALVNTVHLKIGIEWTKKAEYATDNRRKAIIDTVQRLLARGMQEFRRQNDSLSQTAGNGVIGTVTSVSTTGGQDTIICSTDGFGVRLMRFGQYVSVYPTNLSAPRAVTPLSSGDVDNTTALKIDLWDVPNKTIRLKGAVTGIIPGDKIVVNGLSGATPSSILGVPYHHSNASTGFWLGLDRAQNPEIRANRVAAGGALALPFARLAMNKIGDRLGLAKTGGKGTKAQAWMHPCQKQAYEELGMLVSIINKGTGNEGLDLYFGDNMQMAGAPVRPHFSWDKTRIDFIVGNVWGRAEMKPAGYHEVQGRRIFEIRGASGGVAAAQIFYLVISYQFFVENPAACAYIDTLTVPAGY